MSDLNVKIGICGHFGASKNLLNGQTVKTKVLTKELKKIFGKSQVLTIDTYGGYKSLPKCICGLLYFLKHCDHIIILPAHNSIRVFPPFLVVINQFFHRKLHYVVIGGWLPDFILKKKFLTSCLKKFACIYVETLTMKRALVKQGFHNIAVMPNFKELKIVKERDLIYTVSEPYKLCTFSRVMREKGIEDIVEVIKRINYQYSREIFHLDIYGQIENGYEKTFAVLQKQFPDYIKYKGKVSYEKSVDVLKNYFALVFPTKFYMEGVPGTIIDAYAAGTPVIASRWSNFQDVIEDGITGIGYEFSSNKELEKLLIEIAANPELILDMKKNCISKAEHYIPEKVIGKFLGGGYHYLN